MNGKWEIYFEDIEDNRIALSKMGSGIKTIMLVALNVAVWPRVAESNLDKLIFIFEELENNLHPSLLRRLYKYLIEFCKSNHCRLFVTTHSSVVIDTFSFLKSSQILHVNKIGSETKCEIISTVKSKYSILNDLDIKASDLLQSNGIIWVEGPSDRVYINKWLSLLNNELLEGRDYSIMFYGGRLLANLSFDLEYFNKEIIPLLKINRNAFVVMDRDGKIIKQKLNLTKQRIENEIGVNNTWITKGREIENYLSDNTVNDWLNDKFVSRPLFKSSVNDKFGDILNDINDKIKYANNKKSYSLEICEFINEDSLHQLDLFENINRLIKTIKAWN